MKKYLLAAVAALALGGSALADGYHAASKFEQAQASCELTADGMRQSHFFFGSPQFVAGGQIGAGIRGLIDHARQYDACMTLHGYAKNN